MSSFATFVEVVTVYFNSTAVELLTLPILGMQTGESASETGQPELHLVLVFSTRNTEPVISNTYQRKQWLRKEIF